VEQFRRSIVVAERFEMASIQITPLQLELSEGPTELVQLYVGFNGAGGDLVKGKVLLWEGPDLGYTVRMLGRRDVVKGVSASDMHFLPNQEEVDARLPVGATEDGTDTGSGTKCGRCTLHDENRRRKRERPASIFVGVVPVWNKDCLTYRFRVKDKMYGHYADENDAALARDYAARRVAAVTGSKVREINSDQFFLEDALEKARIDKWVDGTFVHAKRETSHGVTERKKAGDITEYRVRFRINDQLVEFGVFDDAEFACLVFDYISRELLKKEAVNFPNRELVGQEQLKRDLRRKYEQATSEGLPVDGAFTAAAKEFWESVEYGPEYVCCSCHQTWFRKSVRDRHCDRESITFL
jgi:hypothetical protein